MSRGDKTTKLITWMQSRPEERLADAVQRKYVDLLLREFQVPSYEEFNDSALSPLRVLVFFFMLER